MTDWADRIVVIVAACWGEPRGAGGAPAVRHVGAACAEDFAAAGAQVVVVDSDAAALTELCDRIQKNGGKAHWLPADLVTPTDLERARDACSARHKRIDVLVNCHTAIEAGGIEASSYDSWRRVVEQDLLGPAFAGKAFLPLLKRGKAPAVVNLGSLDGALGHPLFPSYSAAKGGVAALTRVMAHDFGRYGIRVNCAARGLLAERGAVASPEMAALEAQTVLGRSGYLDELTAVIRFLASDEASYVTGAVIPVDGGLGALTAGTIAHAAAFKAPRT